MDTGDILHGRFLLSVEIVCFNPSAPFFSLEFTFFNSINGKPLAVRCVRSRFFGEGPGVTNFEM